MSGVFRVIFCRHCNERITEIDGETFPAGFIVFHESCIGKFERDIENELIRSIVLK